MLTNTKPKTLLNFINIVIQTYLILAFNDVKMKIFSQKYNSIILIMYSKLVRYSKNNFYTIRIPSLSQKKLYSQLRNLKLKDSIF